jgi:hypothetical protein
MRGRRAFTVRAGRARRAARRAAWALALLGCLVAPAQAAEHPSRNARIALIRSLISEIAVSKIVMPRGKHGLYVNDKGQLDEKRLQEELRSNGPAIRPGMPVEITGLRFKSRRIVVEINGGGKKRRKWYEHIQIGVGNATQPIVPEVSVLTYGSFINLTFPHDTPDLSVQQAQHLLGAVLDFSRHSPTQLYSPSVPPKIKEAIKNHRVVPGMTRDDVLSSKGPPDRRVREVRDQIEQEDWIYGLPPHVLFVTFEGDIVVGVKQY